MGVFRRLAATCLVGIVIAGCSSPKPTSTEPGVSPSPALPRSTAASGPLAPSPSVPASTTSGSPTPQPTAATPVAACRAANLARSIHWNGATGTVLGMVLVRNRGAAACRLEGAPQSVRVRAVGGSQGHITYAAHAAPGPGSDAGVVAPPVILAPGDAATSRFLWSNQCGSRNRVLRILVRLPGDAASLGFDGPGRFGLPRCDAPSQPASIDGYAFEPADQPSA